MNYIVYSNKKRRKKSPYWNCEMKTSKHVSLSWYWAKLNNVIHSFCNKEISIFPKWYEFDPKNICNNTVPWIQVYLICLKQNGTKKKKLMLLQISIW